MSNIISPADTIAIMVSIGNRTSLTNYTFPAIPVVPFGFVGLCVDAEQQNTEAPHVPWTANTGFIVANQEALPLLEEAFQSGDYPYKPGDGSGMGIWPPFNDQAVLNNLLFKKNKIFKLDQRWNYQPILEFFIQGKGWKTWKTNRLYRLSYYIYLLCPFKNKHKLAVKQAYGIHLIKGAYPQFYTHFLF